jgi:hypothetical protein
MSRFYEMSVEISGHRPQQADAVRAAAASLWNFADWDEKDGVLMSSARENLCGGESEEQFAERVSVAVWRANGAYCDVTVDATYLESIPHKTHSLDQADYARLIGKPQEQHDANGPGR